ncbi:kinase-like protein [Cylindrobasidium torrendii FP15055 ss-10]|uniref:cAMP-dependent protein kinase n=1 Tax=Cylindrobasidium torrendii FP15055 ss-10 TaxID=1314674 RepID=A0A0D7B581_9AGAR|nr:kinase-like protein [Cylindrobasidium torrendii FP15055 ss-10]
MSSRQFGSTSSQQFGSSAALDHIAHLSLTQQREKPGYRLADFWIQRTLGTGSFGRVHLVQSKHNLRFYAMKVLNKEKVVRMSQVEHTRNEARLLGLVESDFIIKLWGSFQDTQHLFMIMDFVAGGELFSLLRRSAGGVFPAHTCKFYSAEVYLALEYLHSHGIIYRDLKPENILLNHDGHIKLADFGFAKKCDTTFTMCGTPDYIAPELIAKTRYNKSVDWYALGVLIYEMLAGMPPYHDPRDHHQNPVVLYEKIRMGPDYIHWSSYIDPIARNLIRQLMESDPSKRLGNMQGGPQDIMQHYFYYDVNWEELRRKRTQPPYMPSIHGEGDASAFERYPEDATYGMVTDDLYGDSFPEFNFGF